MKNNKAFTLVELLAVIVILAVILVIAVPQVLDVIDTTKVGSLESSAKLIASTAEKKYAEFLALGKDTSTIKCSDVSKLNNKDYGTCTIKFDENGKATVSIKGKENGKFEGLQCNGTKDNMVCRDIPVVNCSFTPSDEDLAKVYTVKDYDACMTFFKSTVSSDSEIKEEALEIMDSICKGNGIPGYGLTTSVYFEQLILGEMVTEQELIDLNVINAEKSTDLKPGIEYVNGQYTYRYGQEYGRDDWYTTGINGWGVTLTDKESTEDITSEVCTYINGKPIVSMSGMFYQSKAETIDFSNFNTSNVTNMSGMFYNSNATNLNLSSFDTSKVTDMSSMFSNSKATNLDLSSFDTSNVTNMGSMFSSSAATSLDLSNFNTSKVTEMNSMFSHSAATSINLSSFNTSNVTRMDWMFSGSAATSLDLSSFDTSNVTNMMWMFIESAATSIDLSSFDTSNVTSMLAMFKETNVKNLDLSSFDTSNVGDMDQMFYLSKATTGYAKTQADADKFNSSYLKPSTLTFVVKGS